MWAVTPSTYMEPSTPTSNWRLSGNICRRTRGCSKIKIGRKPFTLILLRGRGTGICGGCPASKTLMEMRLCFPRLRNSNNHLRACETIPHPPNPSCCRSCGGMRGWPLPRPTHAPATTLKTNGNSAPIKPMSFPSSAWECVLEDFVLQRLRKIFVGEVFDPLPIFRMGTRHHMFSLYCAIANPSENAVNAAGRIVNYLRKKINGGGKLSQKGNHVPVPH